jgi:hypothetical protein
MGNWCLTATCRQYISISSTHKTQSAGVAKCETAWRCDTEAGSVRDHPPEIGTGYIPDATPTISPQREQTACRGESRAEKSAAVQIQYLPL